MSMQGGHLLQAIVIPPMLGLSVVGVPRCTFGARSCNRPCMGRKSGIEGWGGLEKIPEGSSGIVASVARLHPWTKKEVVVASPIAPVTTSQR